MKVMGSFEKEMLVGKRVGDGRMALKGRSSFYAVLHGANITTPLLIDTG